LPQQGCGLSAWTGSLEVCGGIGVDDRRYVMIRVTEISRCGLNLLDQRFFHRICDGRSCAAAFCRERLQVGDCLQRFCEQRLVRPAWPV